MSAPNNLPGEPTPFIGREQEIAAVGELLQRPEVRLVTLTGAGGSGKTRLALQGGNSLLSAFPDGVFFVNLAPVGDPALVSSTIATALGLKETGNQGLLESLADYLREKHLLLVLDNFEHLLPAAGVVGTLLDRCPQLKMLVTSRAVLHLSREYTFEVKPLDVPDPKQLPDLAHLSQYEAVALFIERAQAAKAGFAITNENAPAVAEICYRLDGLPLAIELAAARIRMFPPHALLGRLGRRLKLLTGGARDWELRQQTLRSTIDWSYDLLDEGVQALFARLSVFAGGCTLEAAEALCDGEGDLGIEVVDGIALLIEQSLLREEGEDESRFLMLETIREYAAEKLEERGEGETIRRRHARHYAGLVEEARLKLWGPEQQVWYDRLEREDDNLRAVLGWAMQQDAEIALRIAGDLRYFWFDRGHWSEGRRWCEEALQAADGDRRYRRLRGEVLRGASVLAEVQGEYERARALSEAGLAIGQELEDQAGIADSLGELGWLALHQEGYERGRALIEESLAIWKELGDKAGIARSLNSLGKIAVNQGEYERAAAFIEESLTIRRELGNKAGVADCLESLGGIAEDQGAYERTRALYEESLGIRRELGDRWCVGGSLLNLGNVALAQGKYEQASILYEQSQAIMRKLGDKRSTALCLANMSELACVQGDNEAAQGLAHEGLELAWKIGDKYIVLGCLIMLGTALGARGIEGCGSISGGSRCSQPSSRRHRTPLDPTTIRQGAPRCAHCPG